MTAGAKIGWLERCTGITEVMTSSLVQACFFFFTRFLLSAAYVGIINYISYIHFHDLLNNYYSITIQLRYKKSLLKID